MKFNNRNTVWENLNKYCHHAKENDFVELTEWTNGEGIDVTVSSHNDNKIFSLTYGELDLINILTNIKE